MSAAVDIPAVQVRGLVRTFTLKGVLNGIDLDIAPGEFVALLGRSGSGKSTLLRALAEIDHEAEGVGEIRLPERISVIFQDARLLPWMRVLDNVLLGVAGQRERGREALAEVGLAGRERAWPHELSGGEQQRVALARALVREPKLLLADEPFGALDALTRIQMHTLLRRLADVHNPAVLLVTHDIDEAILLADRIVMLDDGRLAADLPVRLPEKGIARRERIAELRALLHRMLGVEEAPADYREDAESTPTPNEGDIGAFKKLLTPPDAADTARQARIYERYREVLETAPAWNDTLDTIVSHRSVRAYLPNPVPPGTVPLLVAAAQSAATSSNLQPWSVVAVEDPARKARLAALAGNQKQILQAPLFLLWIVDHHRLTEIGKQVGTPADGLHYLESFLLGAVDTSLAAQNAVVALESIGLGSCYIGGIRNKPAEVAAELGLPPQAFALFGLTVGYPDPAAPASVKPRLPQSAVLFGEQYGAPAAGAIAAYNQRLRSFQREQNMPERDWTEQASQRVRGTASLAGRHLLRGILHRLGFRLE
ncbi:ATP-binding cassette domain-containing protein [Sphingomonas sp.]|uniref:ATP-binding cassette domain-containing protein n=1 Tax=Sphingomonas sp. TaxID=28214 RepID=UPI003B3A1823